jgi:hypothetical protein
VRYGIGETYNPPLVGELPVERWAIAENEKREQIWIDRLNNLAAILKIWRKPQINNPLVVVLSMTRGFEVEAGTYIPWNKLAR